MVSNQEFLNFQQQQTDCPERPSVQLTVNIQLMKRATNLRALNKALAPHNMVAELFRVPCAEASANTTFADIITVKGILPENGFGAQEILEVVKQYYSRARITT